MFTKCTAFKINTFRQMFYIPCCVFVLYSPQSVRAIGQPYSLTSFGPCVGYLSDLAMCMDAKSWH